MKIRQAIEAWLEGLERRNYSKRTRQEYGYDLGHLQRFLAEKGIQEVEGVTSTTLTDYQRWLFYGASGNFVAFRVGMW